MSSLIFSENDNKKIELSATILLSALNVNYYFSSNCSSSSCSSIYYYYYYYCCYCFLTPLSFFLKQTSVRNYFLLLYFIIAIRLQNMYTLLNCMHASDKFSKISQFYLESTPLPGNNSLGVLTLLLSRKIRKTVSIHCVFTVDSRYLEFQGTL